MSRKNKWSFIENKEAREALINGSDLLKECAKTYYVGYKNRFDEIVEPYRYICEGISGVKGRAVWNTRSLSVGRIRFPRGKSCFMGTILLSLSSYIPVILQGERLSSAAEDSW